MPNLKIESWISKLQRPQTEDEARLLEESVLASKRIREPIIVMQGDVIVDGEHRYKLAKKHKLDFETVHIRFEDPKNEVPIWVYKNQLARRNLSPKDFKLYLGRIAKTPIKQGRSPVGHFEPPVETIDNIATKNGVSRATVKRAANLADAHDNASVAAQKAYHDGVLNDTELKAIAEKPKLEQTDIVKRLKIGDNKLRRQLKPKKQPKPKPEKTPAEQFRLLKNATKQYGNQFMRHVDNLHKEKPRKKDRDDFHSAWVKIMEAIAKW